MLLSSWLVLSYQKDMLNSTRRRRWFLYGCFGLAMGLGMWSHLLVLPFVVASLVFLIFFCYRELSLFAVASFMFGLITGFLPSLIFNLQHPSQNSLQALLKLHTSGGTTTGVSFTLWDQIRGTVLMSLPVATGANPQCSVSVTPGLWRTQITSCILVQGVWGIGFLLLYGVVLFLTVYTLVKYVVQHRAITPSDEERHTMRCDAARLTLLVSGGLTLLSYLLSPAPALVPLTSTRYLVGLLVIFPALLAPLWKSIISLFSITWSLCRGHNSLRPDTDNLCRPGRNELRPLQMFTDVGKGAIFLFIYLMYFIGIIGVFQQVPAQQNVNQQQDKMVNDLIHLHDTRIYSDYWTCNILIFQSDERIICSALDEQLQPGENRYLPYQTIVAHDPQAVYVFRIGSPQALALAQRPAQTGQSYEHVEIDNYVLYKPNT